MGFFHFLINPGYSAVAVRALYQFPEYEMKVDYSYDYRAIVSEEDCLAFIKFVGGACK